jgi:hypothetical protein
MKTRILVLAVLAALAGCANLTVKATFTYPAPAAAAK